MLTGKNRLLNGSVAAIVVALVIALSGGEAHVQTRTAPAAGAAGAGNVQEGQALFLRYSCYACHLYSGQGSSNGPGLVPLPMTLARFTAFVRNPGRMPPSTEKVLTDAQLADLFAYIKSLPASPSVKDIPRLMRIIDESSPARRALVRRRIDRALAGSDPVVWTPFARSPGYLIANIASSGRPVVQVWN